MALSIIYTRAGLGIEAPLVTVETSIERPARSQGCWIIPLRTSRMKSSLYSDKR